MYKMYKSMIMAYEMMILEGSQVLEKLSQLFAIFFLLENIYMTKFGFQMNFNERVINTRILTIFSYFQKN